MKNMEWKLTNGKRILVNLDRIDAIIEHGLDERLTVLIFGDESYEIVGKYDEVLKHIPSE